MKNQINKVNAEKASANSKANSLIALDVLKSVKEKIYNRRSIRSLVGQSLYFRSDAATTQRRGAAVYFSRHAPVRVSTDRHQLFPVDPAGT